MRRPFFYALILGFAVGLIIGEKYPLTWLVFACAVLLAAVLFWRRRVVYAVFVVAALAGVVRQKQWSVASERAWSSYYGREVVLSGVVESLNNNWAKIGSLRADKKLPGIIEAKGSFVPGEKVNFSCQVEWPYGDYNRAKSQRLLAQCSTATIIRAAPDRLRGRLYAWRYRISQVILENLRQGEGALAAGILFGDRGEFSDELSEAFRRTGTTHIIALSGFNVTIIFQAVMAPLALWLGRRWGAVGGMMAVAALTIMTGASASVARAATMAGVMQISSLSGRPIEPARLIGYTAILMCWQNPGLLWHDLGFQLSLSSTTGLMYGAEMMQQRLRRVPEFFGIRENLASTLAATAMSLPLMISAFQRLSIVSPLVNILVLPLVPMAMAAAALLGFGGAVWPPLTVLLRPVTEALHHVIILVIQTGAAIPGAATEFSGAAAAAVVAAMVYLFWKYEQKKSDR